MTTQPASPHEASRDRPRYGFISGMGRSGTTLLDKLLCNHPRLSVLSQPFPYLFLHAKRQFLATLGEADCPQPLGHYFLDTRYGLDDLAAFLEHFEVDAQTLQSLFAAMADYDGQYHKPADMAERVARLPGGLFLEAFQQLLCALRHKSGVFAYASKETHCEEFFPFFVRHGVRCVAMLRDPRDVIASFHYGQGTRYGGRRRPTLFYIRNWRKSVAIAILLEEQANFQAVRYEDLVREPEVPLRAVTELLGVEPLPAQAWIGGLRDQDGRPWTGNSSYAPSAELNEQSVGRFRDLLPSTMRRFIEACCLPEMRLLGYEDLLSPRDQERAWEEFKEPFPIERADFASDYSTRPEHLRQERERSRLLCEPELPDEQACFPASIVRDRLRQALS